MCCTMTVGGMSAGSECKNRINGLGAAGGSADGQQPPGFEMPGLAWRRKVCRLNVLALRRWDWRACGTVRPAHFGGGRGAHFLRNVRVSDSTE